MLRSSRPSGPHLKSWNSHSRMVFNIFYCSCLIFSTSYLLIFELWFDFWSCWNHNQLCDGYWCCKFLCWELWFWVLHFITQIGHQDFCFKQIIYNKIFNIYLVLSTLKHSFWLVLWTNTQGLSLGISSYMLFSCIIVMAHWRVTSTLQLINCKP